MNDSSRQASSLLLELKDVRQQPDSALESQLVVGEFDGKRPTGEGGVKVKFRGVGSGRRQVLTLNEDGSISGYAVSADSRFGLNPKPFHIKRGSLKYVMVRSRQNAGVGFLILGVSVLSVIAGWAALTNLFADSGVMQVVIFALWVVSVFVIVELWAAATQSWLEFDLAWGEALLISVAPWSRKKVDHWAIAVSSELGLGSSKVEVDDGKSDSTGRSGGDAP